ncbi:flavin-containing monooxygenase [Kwoniella heveanensis BCC8398]|uniref:Flavin-containing monooxygenase n=1 Tax=Kwoniella heveanensis BCC8398 TaxID=1296120 RepID=A0A1B9GM36_9TREE|nr:flavin-containing monooxygenase [Kwoniella heveanensis BCC8398]
MSPIAIHDSVSSATTTDVSSLKKNVTNSVTSGNEKRPLPVYPDAVAADYMYKFKYNHALPTTGEGFPEVPQETDPKSAAIEVVQQLSKTLSAGDAKGFSELFLEFGVWRDRALITWDYRTFNFREAILKAAADLLPKTPISKVTLIEPTPIVERPYPDLSFVQAHFGLETDIAGGSAVANLILTKNGWKIWTLNTAIESLRGFPEIPERDGHMTGPHSWQAQRELDTAMDNAEPEVLIIGGGQNGLMLAARLKAVGVSSLIVERNGRIGDNWRGRYEALSLHLPHWADHFAYMPYPNHWPTYCPAAKLADWFEWYVSAMELHVWTNSKVAGAKQAADGSWSIEIERDGKIKRTFHPKQLVMATSLAGLPYAPNIPGAEEFKGVIKHSTEHDSSRGWEGKKVLVVGTSSSGFDTAFDFARRKIDVTLLQRSPTYIMSLTHSVPRILAAYKPVNGKRPDLDVADRIAYSMPVGPGEEMGRRLGKELTELDHDLLQAMEDRGFKTWRGQRSTSTQTLGYTKNGGFYFDAGACEQIINGNIKVEQGYIDHFTADKVVLNGDRERQFDLVILATGFSNTIDSVRSTLGDEITSRHKPIWGMDEEGELNSAWRDTGVPNLWLAVGTLQAARYHSQKIALRIKAKLERISPEPYTK